MGFNMNKGIQTVGKTRNIGADVINHLNSRHSQCCSAKHPVSKQKA